MPCCHLLSYLFSYLQDFILYWISYQGETLQSTTLGFIPQASNGWCSIGSSLRSKKMQTNFRSFLTLSKYNRRKLSGNNTLQKNNIPLTHPQDGPQLTCCLEQHQQLHWRWDLSTNAATYCELAPSQTHHLLTKIFMPQVLVRLHIEHITQHTSHHPLHMHITTGSFCV